MQSRLGEALGAFAAVHATFRLSTPDINMEVDVYQSGDPRKNHLTGA